MLATRRGHMDHETPCAGSIAKRVWAFTVDVPAMRSINVCKGS